MSACKQNRRKPCVIYGQSLNLMCVTLQKTSILVEIAVLIQSECDPEEYCTNPSSSCARDGESRHPH